MRAGIAASLAFVAVAGSAAGRDFHHEAALDAQAIDSTLARTPFITVGGRRRRDVALTFDDGPSEFTRRIADVLRHLHAPATFFEIGEQVPDFARSTRLLARDGFPVGDHTQTHPVLAHHRHGFQAGEIGQAGHELLRAGAPFPRLFRPPYGSFNQVTLRILSRLRMLMVLWTNDTEDYKAPGVNKIVEAALADLRPGAIILMHDGGGDRRQTVAALPIIVHRLRARGYHLVTIPRMLREDPPAIPQPLADGTGPSATS